MVKFCFGFGVWVRNLLEENLLYTHTFQNPISDIDNYSKEVNFVTSLGHFDD